MVHPVLLVVGYCTTTTAQVLAVFARDGLRVARLLYKAGAHEELAYVDVVPQPCPPYQLATFALAHLPASADGTLIQYVAAGYARVPEGPPASAFAAAVPRTFRLLPAAARPLRFALVSCNGTYEVRDPQRRYGLWRALKQEIEAGNVDFILHAGDQIYAEVLGITSGHVRQRAAPGRAQSLVAQYRRLYVETWSAPAVAEVLASCPSIMMWDDHEIYDSYGSHPDDETPQAQAIFAAAARAFREFQVCHNPPRLGPHSYAYAFEVCDTAFVVTDGRTNRMRARQTMLGDQQLQALERWLHTLTARRPQHLFLVTATPVLYVHLIAFLKLVQVVGWESPLTENIQDAWLAPHNQAECRRLLHMLFAFCRHSPATKVVILSGDVHVSALGLIRSTQPGDEQLQIRQIVSSGIGSRPPSRLAALLFQLAAAHPVALPESPFVGSLQRFPQGTRYFLARRNFALIEAGSPLTIRFVAEAKQGPEYFASPLG
jgi:PhoD-like phosphatase